VNQQAHWELDGNADERYERHLVPAMFGPWAEDLVALAAPQPGESVLDVACGSGVVARLVAQRVGPSGKVVGLDFNAGRLAVARSLPPLLGAAIEWREGDALALPFANGTFAQVCCQQGLQFFPDRLKALIEMHRVLIPGGRLALNVWRSIEYNPGAAAMAEALERHVSPEAATFRRSPFAFGDGGELQRFVTDAGFRDVVVRPAVKVLHFPSAEDFVRRYVSGVAPLAQMVAQASDSGRAAVLTDVGMALRSYVGAEGLAIPKASHLVTAHT
jgi:ubiquinone/menaquinone biosynthesis C-methylase UbiE